MGEEKSLRLLRHIKEVEFEGSDHKGDIYFLTGLSEYEFSVGTVFTWRISTDLVINLKLVDIMFYNNHIEKIPLGSRVASGFTLDQTQKERILDIETDEEGFFDDLRIYEIN